MKIIIIFSSENFHFLVVKSSVYLNRHVFVMVRDADLHLRWAHMSDVAAHIKVRFLTLQHTFNAKVPLTCAPSEDADQPTLCAVGSESSIGMFLTARDTKFLYADNDDSDPHRLI